MKYVGSLPPQGYTFGAAYQNAAPNYYYNGGGYYQQPYYGYGYKQMYDTLEIRRRQEEEAKRRLEERNGQIESMKEMIRVNCHFFGEEVDNDSLNEYYSDNRLFDIQKENQERAEMYNIHQNHMQQVAYRKQMEQQRMNMTYNTEVKDMSLLEFLSGPGRDDYIAALENKRYHESRQAIGGLYNHQGYDELLKIHNANKYLNPYATIDDMEISLPSHIKREKDIRRQQFLQSIMTGAGVMNG